MHIAGKWHVSRTGATGCAQIPYQFADVDTATTASFVTFTYLLVLNLDLNIVCIQIY